MPSILEEYRRRHRIESINPIPEGVLFLSDGPAKRLVCLTSSYTKSTTLCEECASAPPKLVLELFKPSCIPYLIQLVVHCHIEPDADLLEVIQVVMGSRYVPFMSKGERDQEEWLWRTFRQAVGQGNGNRQQRREALQENWIADAIRLASNNPDLFSNFYEQMYSPLVINRRYILAE